MLSANLVTALALFGPAAEPAAAPTPAAVRQTVERSLVFLEKEGLAWLDRSKCIACHHAAFMIWSHREARERGFTVDAAKLDAWTTRSLNLYLADRAKNEKNKSGNVEAMNMLLSQAGTPPAAGPTTEAFQVATNLLTNGQRADGSWKFEGQTQDRPAEEADEATTLWAFLALASVDPDNKAWAASRERALAWVRQPKSGAGNEVLALRVVIEVKFGDADKARALAATLMSQQNTEGGWSWAKGRASDAFATGQSLYALGLAGHKHDEAVIQNAWKFLAATQRPDGSWLAPTKKKSGGNMIASYWGTAWATIGLARTLP